MMETIEIVRKSFAPEEEAIAHLVCEFDRIFTEVALVVERWARTPPINSEDEQAFNHLIDLAKEAFLAGYGQGAFDIAAMVDGGIRGPAFRKIVDKAMALDAIELKNRKKSIMCFLSSARERPTGKGGEELTPKDSDDLWARRLMTTYFYFKPIVEAEGGGEHDRPGL